MSTATHGYSNILAQGKPYYNTVHRIGSGKTAQNLVMKSLAELTAIPQSIVSVSNRDKNKELIIEITAHGAKVGDVCRIYSGVATRTEYDIVEVIDANHFVVQNVAGVTPVAADTAKILFYVTPKADSEGNVNFSPGPTQFVLNGASSQVIQDDIVPANNKPLPAGMYILKDGVAYPVQIDTIDPTQTMAVPVVLQGASGPINITAGDLNVQLSDAGVNFDATRVGDGSGIYLKINADGSLNIVLDAASKAVLDAIKANGDALNLKDFSTGAKQDLAKAVLDLIKSNGDTLNLKDFSTAAKQDLAKAVLDLIKTNGDTLNAKDFATQTTLASMSAKLPANLGQKPMATSLAVALASDQTPLSITNSDTLSLTGLSAGALNALLVPATDVSKYSNVSVQVLGTFVGTLSFQGSNDNTSWSPVNMQATTSGTSGVTSTLTTTGFVVVPVFFKYFRVIMTAYTSGSATGSALFSSAAPDSLGAVTVTGTTTVQQSPKVATYAENLSIDSATGATFSPPANCRWFKIWASPDNQARLRFKVGATASSTSGIPLEAGRSEDFDAAGTISIFSEGITGAAYVQWGV